MYHQRSIILQKVPCIQHTNDASTYTKLLLVASIPNNQHKLSTKHLRPIFVECIINILEIAVAHKHCCLVDSVCQLSAHNRLLGYGQRCMCQRSQCRSNTIKTFPEVEYTSSETGPDRAHSFNNGRCVQAHGMQDGNWNSHAINHRAGIARPVQRRTRPACLIIMSHIAMQMYNEPLRCWTHTRKPMRCDRRRSGKWTT